MPENEATNGEATDVQQPLREPRETTDETRALNIAVRAWSLVHGGEDLHQDSSAGHRLEWLARCYLHDAIGQLVDGRSPNLAQFGLQKMRALCGDTEAAQTEQDYARTLDRVEDATALMGSPAQRQRAGRKLLSELSQKLTGSARQVVIDLLAGKRASEAGHVGGQGEPITPDRLLRVLVIDANIPAEDAHRAYEAACDVLG